MAELTMKIEDKDTTDKRTKIVLFRKVPSTGAYVKRHTEMVCEFIINHPEIKLSITDRHRLGEIAAEGIKKVCGKEIVMSSIEIDPVITATIII